MNPDGLLSDMLAWRQLLSKRNPDLLASVRETWGRWTAIQRAYPLDPSKRQLIAVAKLSCVEDLMAHVGLAQLLALQNLRISVVLSFPTAPMTQIARAKSLREEWHGLVQIVDDSTLRQLLKNLPHDCPLALFSGPAILSPQCLGDLFIPRYPWYLLPRVDKQLQPYRAFRFGGGFISRACDYFDPDAQGHYETSLAVGDLDLLRCGPRDVGLMPPRVMLKQRTRWPRRNFPLESEPSSRDAIDVAAVDSSDEIVLRMYRQPLPSTVIGRRLASLCPPGEPLNVRLSADMLTPQRKVLRLESYKPNGSVTGTNLIVHVRPSDLKGWMISSYLNRGGGGNAVIRAFAEGVGCRLAYAEDEGPTLRDIPVVWGVLRDSDRILAQARAQSLYYFYVDHAYFDRGHGKSYRITRNRYEAGPIRRCPPDRLAELGVQVKPWRQSGREILVCPPTDYFIQAHGCADWLDTTLETLHSLTDRPIVIREKPQLGQAAVPLAAALKSAHALVTHSSNVAIEAACLGTPVFVNPASAAAPVGQTDLSLIETPVYPDRDPWLAHLAYNQFSIEEVRNGEAWRLLMELEERDFA